MLLYPFILHKKSCHDRDGELLVPYVRSTITDQRILLVYVGIVYNNVYDP